VTLSSYLSVRDVARDLGLAEMTVYRWIWGGRLPSVRAGRLIRIRREDLEAFLRTR
jgi:excisionase family DNA binding protein